MTSISNTMSVSGNSHGVADVYQVQYPVTFIDSLNKCFVIYNMEMHALCLPIRWDWRIFSWLLAFGICICICICVWYMAFGTWLLWTAEPHSFVVAKIFSKFQNFGIFLISAVLVLFLFLLSFCSVLFCSGSGSRPRPRPYFFQGAAPHRTNDSMASHCTAPHFSVGFFFIVCFLFFQSWVSTTGSYNL